jgi:ectoine hydroxylase-related dioxygenase (phytanoyl-CoA dioxygenase family)
MGPAAPEAIVNFLIALTDFTDENGATRVIPGSHKWADYDDRGTPEMTIPVEMKAGDAVFYSGKMVHGGGANRTTDQYRRALTIPLILGFLTPEDALPLVVDRELIRPLPQRVQRLLGFRSHFFGGAPIWQVNGRDIGDYLGL